MKFIREWIKQAAYEGTHQALTEHATATKIKRKLNIDNEYVEEHLAAEKAHAVATQGGFAKSKRATNRI
jgi:hypothetical protein